MSWDAPLCDQPHCLMSQYPSIYITHFSVSPRQGSLLLLTGPVWVEANQIRIQRVQPSIHSVLALLGSPSTTFTLATDKVCGWDMFPCDMMLCVKWLKWVIIRHYSQTIKFERICLLCCLVPYSLCYEGEVNLVSVLDDETYSWYLTSNCIKSHFPILMSSTLNPRQALSAGPWR